MSNPAISVIVAIYQAEAYLNRCVDSILNQSFTDFELLLVDDGSTDGSGEICDEYAKKDSRVRVFHKQNEGRCLTRKKGIEEAVGEYSIHCDPDDWMDSQMFEVLYRKAKETGADIVLSDVILENEEGPSYLSQKPSSLDPQTLINEMYQPVMPSLWNKLIRTKCYAECNVKYAKDVEYAEDLYILLQLLTHDVSLAYEPVACYHYDRFTNPNNITKHIDLETYIRSVQSFSAIESETLAVPINRKKVDVLWYIYNYYRPQLRQYDGLYPEINAFLLSEGLRHPMKHWNYWVIVLHRKGWGWLGELFNNAVSFILKHR